MLGSRVRLSRQRCRKGSNSAAEPHLRRGSPQITGTQAEEWRGRDGPAPDIPAMLSAFGAYPRRRRTGADKPHHCFTKLSGLDAGSMLRQPLRRPVFSIELAVCANPLEVVQSDV